MVKAPDFDSGISGSNPDFPAIKNMKGEDNMSFPITVSAIILGLIIVIPILGNLRTPENLYEWYLGNSFRAALIAGLIAIAIVWGVWFLVM